MNTTCKECLPLILSTGSLMSYLKEDEANGNVLVYFMPATGGNCRFGQYHVFLKSLIRKNHIRDLAVWAIDTQNSYVGLGMKFNRLVLKALVISDVMYDIKNTLKVIARDRPKALEIFDREWLKLIGCLERNGQGLEEKLKETAGVLKGIALKYPFAQAKFVALMGEIFVRRDDF